MNHQDDVSANDRSLGMDRPVPRRDFLSGIAVGLGASWLTFSQALAQEQPFAPEQAPDYYPPMRTGMRGSHEGSFEVAHNLRDTRSVNLSGATDTREIYDLVVVGAGMSGLAAAHYYIKNMGRNVRVLVRDNHDDFGGHAKRNQFEVGGRTLAINGGTLNIESPNFYNARPNNCWPTSEST